MKEVPIKNRKFRHVLLPAVACYLAAIEVATNVWADPPSQIPPPIPTPPPVSIGNVPRTWPYRVASVTLSDQSIVLTRAVADKFQMIAARPGERVTVVVPMPVTALPTNAAVQALDGGEFVTIPAAPLPPVTSVSLTVPVVNGKAVFNFQVAMSPGLYRVLVLGVGRAATLQFWVQNVQRPATNPWAINSAHWQSQ